MSQKQSSKSDSQQFQDGQYLFEKLVYCIEKFATQLGVANAFAGSLIASHTAQLERMSTQDSLDASKRTELENLKKDLEGLNSYLRQTQIDLFDILQDFKSGEKDLDKNHLFDYKALEEADSVAARMTQYLPKRETPILPAGNILAVSMFLSHSFAKEAQLTFGLYLGKNEEVLKIEAIKKMAIFLEKLENTIFLLARWSNLVIDKKEFIWTPPKKPGEENQSNQFSNQPVNPTGQFPNQPSNPNPES